MAEDGGVGTLNPESQEQLDISQSTVTNGVSSSDNNSELVNGDRDSHSRSTTNGMNGHNNDSATKAKNTSGEVVVAVKSAPAARKGAKAAMKDADISAALDESIADNADSEYSASESEEDEEIEGEAEEDSTGLSCLDTKYRYLFSYVV